MSVYSKRRFINCHRMLALTQGVQSVTILEDQNLGQVKVIGLWTFPVSAQHWNSDWRIVSADTFLPGVSIHSQMQLLLRSSIHTATGCTQEASTGP